MLSIDPRQVESLSQLTGFLDFLQNPDKYKKMIEEINTTLLEMQKITSLYSSVEEGNKFLNESRLKYKKADEDISVILTTASDKAKEILYKATKDAENKKKELLEIEEKLSTMAKQTEVNLEASKKDLEVAKKERLSAEELNEKLNKEFSEVSAIKKEFEAKVEKLKAVMG